MRVHGSAMSRSEAGRSSGRSRPVSRTRSPRPLPRRPTGFSPPTKRKTSAGKVRAPAPRRGFARLEPAARLRRRSRPEVRQDALDRQRARGRDAGSGRERGAGGLGRHRDAQAPGQEPRRRARGGPEQARGAGHGPAASRRRKSQSAAASQRRARRADASGRRTAPEEDPDDERDRRRDRRGLAFAGDRPDHRAGGRSSVTTASTRCVKGKRS